jgi:hypothetical protein
MSAASDSHEFHRYLGDRLREGADGMSPEEILDEWRQSHPDDDSMTLSPQEIQEVLADLDSGELGMLLEDFMQQMRLKHGLH